MNKLRKNAGIALIFVGIELMVVLQITRLTFLNWLLLIPLVMIVSGVVWHVWQEKKAFQ